MRLVATLLRNFRCITGIKQYSMWDALTSENYRLLVYAVLTTATHDLEDVNELKSPSNAIKLGFDVKRMIGVKIAEAVIRKDNDSRRDAEDLMLVVNTYWSTDVTKIARIVLLDRQFNKEVLLPVPEDVTKLNDYMNEEINNLDLNTITLENFKKVSRLCGAKITLYNRRRPGEVENLK